MLASKPDRRMRAALAVVCVLCGLHLLSGLAWTPESGPRSGPGLRPRHASRVQVRGRTYHVHFDQPVDLKLRRELEARLKNNQLVKPHLVARRRILSEGSASGVASDYLGRDQEEAVPNVTCNSCSLVGYSGHLLGSELGRTIDSSDCVIRMGRAPAIGYDVDVGQKTTFRVLDATTFYNLLRKPSRFTAGPLASRNVVVFGTPSAQSRRDSSNSNAGIRARLRRLSADIGVFALKRSGEHRAAEALAAAAGKLGYQLSGTQPSALWYAVKLSDDVGCGSLSVFGVPDPRFCKRSKNESSRSRYWDFSSHDQCVEGSDAGLGPSADASQLSVPDRKALRGWSTLRSAVFSAPPWPRGKKH